MQIYAEYGFSKEFTVNVVRPGKTGADEIKQMMTDFRANPPQELGGSKVVTWKDYQSLEVKHADGSVEKLDMPATSNVLQWFCDDNTKVSVRPSVQSLRSSSILRLRILHSSVLVATTAAQLLQWIRSRLSRRARSWINFIGNHIMALR